MLSTMISLGDVLFITRLVFCFALLVQSFEFIYLLKSTRLGQPWGWQNVSIEYNFFHRHIRDLFFWIYQDWVFRLICFFHLSMILLLTFSPSLTAVCTLFALHALILLRWRGSFNGGSDGMTLVVFMGLMVSLSSSDEFVQKMGLWFIGLQAIWSYFVAGLVKIKDPLWRRGDAIVGFLKFNINPPSLLLTTSVLSRPSFFSWLVCWIVMLWELSFPLAIFYDDLLWFYLPSGFLFHLTNSYVFSLNRFLLVWISTYPAIIFISQSLAQ